MKSLTLPEPAKQLWRNTRDVISDLRLPATRVKARIGGGTILAAQWEHRVSTDIDVQIEGTNDLTDIRKGREHDLARRIGGQWELDSRHQVKVRLNEGVIDISTVAPQPDRGAYEVELDGRAQTVLSNIQILRGKLERAEDPGPVRDAYDLATAAKRDPEALVAAIGMLPDKRAKRISADLRKREKAIAEAARKRIRTRGSDRIEPELLGRSAAAAFDDHRTVYVKIELDKGRIRATRYTRNGTPYSQTWSPARAKSGLNASGLEDYIKENTTTSMRRIGMSIDKAVAEGRDQVIYEAGSENRARTLEVMANRQSEPLGSRDDSKKQREQGQRVTATPEHGHERKTRLTTAESGDDAPGRPRQAARRG